MLYYTFCNSKRNGDNNSGSSNSDGGSSSSGSGNRGDGGNSDSGDDNSGGSGDSNGDNCGDGNYNHFDNLPMLLSALTKDKDCKDFTLQGHCENFTLKKPYLTHYCNSDIKLFKNENINTSKEEHKNVIFIDRLANISDSIKTLEKLYHNPYQMITRNIAINPWYLFKIVLNNFYYYNSLVK
jgi:hypothetical protein